MYKNILITGKIQCGKSTLINKILNSLIIPYCGYRTIPYYQKEMKAGYYIESVNLENQLKEKISVNISLNKCTPIIRGFDIVGVNILKDSIKNRISKIILLDEIGVLEKCSPNFMEQINNCFNCEKVVIGALKKRDDEFLDTIKSRKDVLIIDIENSTYEEIQIIRKQVIENINNVFRNE